MTGAFTTAFTTAKKCDPAADVLFFSSIPRLGVSRYSLVYVYFFSLNCVILKSYDYVFVIVTRYLGDGVNGGPGPPLAGEKESVCLWPLEGVLASGKKSRLKAAKRKQQIQKNRK